MTRVSPVRAGLLSLAIATLLVGCGNSGESTSTPPQSPKPTGAQAHDAELLRGRTIFQDNCAECHGFSGSGGLGPAFTDGKLLRDFADVDAQVAFVKQGKGVMPGFAER